MDLMQAAGNLIRDTNAISQDLGEPQCDDILIQLKASKRSIVMTIHDEDGVASFNRDEAESLHDWLGRAIAIMKSDDAG